MLTLGWMWLVMGVVIVAVVVAVVRSSRRRSSLSNAPLLSSAARVIDKRSHVTGTNNSMTTLYFATFELPDGQRLELALDGQASGQLIVGDSGALQWQGSWFRSFQRELMR
jgi:hypothetical protein